MSNSGYNKYDIFLFLLVASIAGGNIGGSLQIPRLLTILLLIPCIKNSSNIGGRLKDLKIWMSLFLMYGLIATLWSPAGISESITIVVYNIVHVIYFYEIILFSSKAHKPFKSIAVAFLVAFFITAVIGAWELSTDHHLSMSKREEAKMGNTGYVVYLRYFAAATFYNLNTYVTYLCFLLPFLYYGYSSQLFNKKLKICFVASIIAATVLILYNASRGGLVASLIMFLVFVIYSHRSKSTIVLSVITIGALVFILTKFGDSILNTLMVRASVQGNIEDEGRFYIWGNVMNVVVDYMGIGCGPGGLPNAMLKYAHGGITISHNMFLEVLAQYGIIFFLVYIYFLINMFFSARQCRDNSRKLCVYQSLFSLPIVSIINSGYLTSPFMWTAMATLYIYANYERIKSFN